MGALGELTWVHSIKCIHMGSFTSELGCIHFGHLFGPIHLGVFAKVKLLGCIHLVAFTWMNSFEFIHLGVFTGVH